MKLNRRNLMSFAAIGIASGSIKPLEALARRPERTRVRIIPAQLEWDLPPQQNDEIEHFVDMGDARLQYRDPGGNGVPVVFLHPATGCTLSWAFQEPVFSSAGFRFISYSRRSYYRSSGTRTRGGGQDLSDLEALVDALKLDRFHLAGVAAGGFQVVAYARKHPQRLRSMSIICSLGGVNEPDYSTVTQAMTGGGFTTLEEYMRELGPSFRAANPHGVERWVETEHAARANQVRNSGPPPEMTGLKWEEFEKIRLPTLLATGDADMYMPPSRLREFSTHMPHAETVIFSECGHAPFWEQPIAFNSTLIDFFRRHE